MNAFKTFISLLIKKKIAIHVKEYFMLIVIYIYLSIFQDTSRKMEDSKSKLESVAKNYFNTSKTQRK